MKQTWGSDEYIDCCNGTERRDMDWQRPEIYKLRGSGKGIERERATYNY
jgi:hypothetical protein